MKITITRFEPHQNAKVLAVMIAALSLVFVLPMMLVMVIFIPDQSGLPGISGWGAILFAPLMYMTFTYIAVATGMYILNIVTKYTGGLEFDAEQDLADQNSASRR